MIVEETTISTERIYEGSILNLRRDKVIVRGGESYREIVEHNGGVVIVAVTEDLKLPLVRQFRKSADAVVLELPAGKLDRNENGDVENPQEAAKRELKEETGYTASTIMPLVNAYSSIGYSTEILYFYLATSLVKGETCFDPHEAIEIEEYSLEEAYKKCISGEIIDQKTICGILLAYEKLMK